MSSGRVPSGINDFDDEEYQMAIAMSLSVMAESNNNDNNNNNNNNNDNNDNNNNNENNSGDNNNNNNDNNDDNNIINEEEEENDDFIQQYTINCIYRRALCGAYDPILVLDEIMEGDDEKDKEGSSKSKTAQRGLLDTSLIADESEKRILEMNDAKLISSLPIFTRLLMQNLNEISTEGKKNLAKCANFALLTLKCYKNAVESSIYLLTREICPLFDTQKLYAFLSDSISMIFEVMAKYPTVLEIDTIRTALLDIMMLLLVENKSINATQNILTEGDAEKMKGMAKDSKRDILDKKLTAENSALKEEIIALMVGDDDNDDKNAADNSTKDLYSDNIALFMKEKGLERILDFVFQKIAGITTTTATEPSEIKEKKQRTEDVCVDEDLYYVVSAFMKLFSNIYSAIANKGFLAKEDDGTIRSINDKLSTIFSSIILRDFAAESVLPPFQLFLVIFKIFSDGFASNEMSKMNSLRNLKTLLAYKIVRSYVDASKEAKAKWLTCPLSKNTQSILAYTIDSLSYSFSTCKKLRSPDSQSLSLAREKIELACASASRGEYKYLSEALEQDACDVLSALALPSGEDESIIDIFISMSAALSKNLGFGAKGSDIKDPITVGEAKGSSISESLSENSSSSYMLGDLFGSEESQNGVEAGGNQNGGTKNEDDTCNLCAKLFAMCKQLIATAGAPKVSMKALDSLVAFAQNISPNDNITQAAESAAFAKSIRSKKNYQQVVTSFRDFTRVLLASDAKVGGNVGEAIARKVFEKFPLFGPLECVIMTTRFWAMNRVRAGSSADVRPLPAAVEIVHRFVDSLADRATSGSNNDYLELVNYERSEEILFIYNYCLTKESRMEVALFSLIKLAKTAEGVGSVKCSENLIALTRLVDFATYFSMFINKAPHTFANSVTENILERQFGESPAEEAFPCSVIADRNILFEHAAKHLELQPYYLFAGGKEEKCVLEAPIANCISSNVRSYIKLMGFAYENCDSRLMNYYKRVTYNFFLTVLTTKPGEEWVDDALLGSDTGLNSRGAVLLLLIGAFVESGSADLLKSLAEKVIDALSNESQTIDDDSTTFGLLLFVLSAIEANKPTKRDVSVPKRDKYTSLFETLASFDAKAETLGSDELVAQVSVPVSCIDIAAKPELEWDAKMVPMMNIAEKLLSKYIDIVGGKEANRLRGFVYGGLSFDKGVAAALLPEAEAYKKKFGDIATLPPIEQEEKEDSKLSAKDTLLHYVMSLANEKDREVALKINLNMAALIMIKIVCLGEQPKLNDAIDRFTSVCLAIDNFRFANYGVFFDTIVAVNKECTKTIAAGLWSLFAGPRTATTSSSSSDEDRKAFSELVDSNAVLERLLKMHAMYPNHKTLYNIFVTYNGTHTNKIASALLKDGEKETAGNRDYLIEAIRENGLNPEDDAVVQSVVLKLLASPMKDSINFLCDVVKNDSDECPTAGFANKLYETLLNIIDNREVHAKIPPKTYFITIQLVSFRCSRLIDLFKFSVERLRAANSRMVVEDSDKAAAAELGRGVFVYPFITIIRSVIRMLTFKEAVKDGDPNMLIDQEETKVKNALDKMAESKPYWGCPENDPSIECTFVKTGKNFVDQTTYRCKTCQLVGNFGCCVMCAATCHKGHDLSLGNISSGFYCDCGDGSVSSCTKCILCNREESAKDDAMEVEKEHLPEQRGLYDIDALKPDYVAKLRAEVFNQDVSDVLNEYFNTYSASFISDINKEASTSGDESAQTTTTTAATGTKVQAERNEVTARTAVAKLSPEACRRLMSNSSLTGCVKQGNFSFATSRLNNDFPMYYDGSLPGMQSYAAVSAPFRKDAVAVLSRDTLRVLKLRDIVRSASQNSVASVPLPIRACGLAFHPTTPNLLTVFSPVECYVMLLERNSYSKVAHQTPVTLPQDDDYIILNVFWIPVPDTVGPFLCVVANKGVFVYDITKNADEPVVLCRNTRITGAVCVKAEVSAGTSQAPAAKVVLLSLSRGRGGSELDALCISGLGAEKASVEVKKVPKEGVAGDYAGIYYAESSKLLLLSLVRPSSVQGFFVTVDDDFNVALGNSMKVFGTTLLGITETVVEGVTVIAGFNRDRTNVYTLALGNEKVLYATAELASTVSGYNILESEDEGANESYLFIIQTNSRTGTSTISKRHVAASSNAIPSRNDAKAPAKADSGENAKAKKAKSATEPVSYAYMPQSAPELSCNSVYAMIRGDAKSYVIDGDLAGVMSPAAVRDKLMEPEASDYSRCGVLSLKRGEFTLRVVNTNSSRVITGIQIGLAHVHKGNVPDYITVYNRCIVVPNKDNLCISIPFTFQEIICSKSHVSIHFGPSKNGYEKVYIDYITPFFTEKKDFGLASEEWPSKRELIGYVSSTGARYVTSATSTATALITSLRAMEAVAVAPSADKKERSLVDTLLRVFTSVPGKVSKRFRLLDMIESHIKKSPAFVANVVESLSLIVDAIKDDSNENSRAAQLSTIATFLERVLSGESEEAFAAIVRSNIVRKLCDAAQTVGSAAAVEREGFIQGIVSLIFTTQVAMLSRGGGPAEGADDVHKALLDALLSLIVSENGAVRNGCSLAMRSHFERMSDGYRVTVEPSADRGTSSDFARSMCDYSAQYGGNAEVLIAAAKRMSLAAAKSEKLGPKSVVKSAVCLAPNTVDFCVWELQNLLGALPALAGLCGGDDVWDGRLIPVLYTILHLAVRAIRAAALCRPRSYVADLCRVVVRSLLPAASAAEFLSKEVMAGLPSTKSCYAVLRVATIATIVRECSRSSSGGATHEAVKWMAESLPKDFAAALYAFMDGPFTAEYERLSKLKASEAKLNTAAKATPKNCMPAELFRSKASAAAAAAVMETGKPSDKESWAPLLADIFADALGGSPGITSFLYSKRLYIAALYLARKVAVVATSSPMTQGKDGNDAATEKHLFNEEQWAELIGRCMVQSKLRYAYPSLLKLARSILSSDTALFAKIDAVSQSKLSATLETLHARTEHFARAPSAEEQGRLLDLLYAQLSVTAQRPHNWRAYGLKHPTTAALLYRLVIEYAQNRRIRKDIVSISLALLGHLLDEDSKEECVLGDEVAKLIEDGGKIMYTLGDFINLFVVGTEPYAHPRRSVMASAANFVGVLLRTKLVSKAAANVVTSFLDDVVSNHPTAASSYYMDIVTDALSMNSEGNELCLLEALDAHTRNLNTYPEASLMVAAESGAIPPSECSTCVMDSAFDCDYYEISALCARDRIQVLQSSVTFMFGAQHGATSSSSLFVENVSVKLPYSVKISNKEVVVSVAYKPPVSSNSAGNAQSSQNEEEFKWAVISTIQGACGSTSVLGCGLHIVGVKVEVSGSVDEKGGVFVCSNCNCEMASLVCKKCRMFASDSMIWVGPGPVTPVKDRLDSEESVKKEIANLEEKLADTTLPNFLPK